MAGSLEAASIALPAGNGERLTGVVFRTDFAVFALEAFDGVETGH